MEQRFWLVYLNLKIEKTCSKISFSLLKILKGFGGKGRFGVDEGNGIGDQEGVGLAIGV